MGTGPAGPLWLTPETRGALAAADDLVGYTTYLDRVPVRPGQRRHGSDNKVESERAEFALDLARRGGASPWSRAATRASSRWPPPYWRWRRADRTGTFPYGCCPA